MATVTPRAALQWDYAPAPESRDAASLKPSYDLFIDGAFVAPTDGTRVATVNLYSATVQPAQVIYTREGLASTTHQVELRVLGTRTAPSTGNRVDIDGFIALR